MMHLTPDPFEPKSLADLVDEFGDYFGCERIERPQPIDVQPIGLSAETLAWAKKERGDE